MPDTNLPLQLTRFVGREAELAEITRLLSSPVSRLVTLTGAGGIGKTRFALKAASSRLEAYANGVWVIELAGRAAACLRTLAQSNRKRSLCTGDSGSKR